MVLQKAYMESLAGLAAELAELRARVQVMSDRADIHDLYMRYMRAFDRNDLELLRDAFWPDAQINYGTQSNTLDEFIVRHLHQHLDRYASWGHLLTNESVVIGGDTAHVETYVTALFTPRGGDPEIVGGRYIDRVDCRSGKWRIAVREFVPHFELRKETRLDFRSWGGTWDRSDPSYRRPLLAREPSGTTE